ncbi:MAG: DUF427 domain-containing protein [Pseudomonadota bacterium]
MWTYTGKGRPDFAKAPGPGQESVWDYPRPPALAPDARRVRVHHDGSVLADSTRAVRILETASPPTFYLPPDDVNVAALVAAAGQSFCEWKGLASYLALKAAPESQAVAWYYTEPTAPFESLAGYIAFYPSRVTCFVDEERVRPQAGEFYGGWVTDEIVGPFKGDPSTGHW